MAKILVTGATGVLGAILAKWLQENNSGPVWRTGRQQLTEQDYYPCDLTDADATRLCMAKLKPQMIFHMAGDYANKSNLNCSINSLGAKHIIEGLIDEGVDARVVLIGSAAEYGVVLPEENPVNENRVLRPISVYGLTKAFQTQMGIYFARNSNVEIITARMFNLLAPGFPEQLFVGNVEKQIAAFLRGETKEIILGDLSTQRDYISVNQAIEQLNLIARRGISGEVYHVASGQPIRMRELLRKLMEDAGVDSMNIRENIKPVGKVGYDAPVIYADTSKTHNLMMGDMSK